MKKAHPDQHFCEYILDLLAAEPGCYAKRMFGGFGLSHDATMWALIVDSTLYLKADDEFKSYFVERELRPFTYWRQDKEISLSYFQAPQEALEDSQIMCELMQKSLAAAKRSKK